GLFDEGQEYVYNYNGV
nr:artemocyanin=extracellular biliprotein {N-terminal} [Streptocephalus proboscideus=fairy shrimps, hemolymph, Peptide Partial, 16 aa] [Streptocephalus proboscideus]